MPLHEKFPGDGGTPTFWVRSMAGVSIRGESGSEEIGTKGLALIIAEISAMNVDSTSCERGREPYCINIESKILLTKDKTPIKRSQAPPMCEAWGELNSHEQEQLVRYFYISGSFATLANPSSLLAATKLVPQSERNCLTGPLIAKNLRIAFIQLEVSRDSIISM